NVDSNSITLPSIGIQTGATSGVIKVSMRIQGGGQEISAPDLEIRVPKMPPVIRSVKLSRTATTFRVDISGFSTPREITEAVFHFNGSPGTDLKASDLRLPVADSFNTWFRDHNSHEFGSQVTYSQTFNVQGGDASSIGSVTVMPTNSVGVSAAATSN